MEDLPVGTVTFVFTDIEGSTRLLQALGERYGDVLESHRRTIREAAAHHGGREFGTEGDASFLVFPLAPEALVAAVEVQRALARAGEEGVRVRIGVHTGEGHLRGGDYVGLDVHRAARIAAAGHGGQILLSEPTRALVAEHLPPGARLRDLGEHRLKDLNHPERLYQVEVDGLPTRFPPLRGVELAGGNLPIQLTRFVGRDRELAEAGRLLGETRLLTFTGAGGTGKTRLAIQLADRLREDFPGGAWFVPLASLTDPSLVPSTIADSLELAEARGDRRTPLERVADHLRERELLLVLDNFEQVLEAAPVVTELLRAAPRVKVLVTSRAALRVYGEREFPVPPLRLPDPRHLPDLESLSQYEAVALFIDRATAVRPDFAITNENAPAVAEICARLDGLPLAIELAAARIRLLTPEQVLARLSDRLALLSGGPRDLPARQQTLRGAIAWSHDLLGPAEQRLFARMAVFSGGCGVEQAEAVCGPPDDLGVDVLEGAMTLAEQSLMVVREDAPDGLRFGMLETIREFALERLEATPEAEPVRRRHAEAYAELAERAEPELTGRGGRRWLDRLEPDHDNFRAAVQWAVGGHRAATALRLVAALWRFWQMRGHLREGRMWADRALALPGAEDHPRERVRALIAAGSMAYWQADTEGTVRLYEEGLQRAEALGDRDLLAEALYNASFSASASLGYSIPTQPPEAVAEQLGRAVARLERSLALFEEIGDRGGVARAHWGLGDFVLARGDVERGRDHLETALALAREVDDVFLQSWAQYMLGATAREAGDLQEAERRFREALRAFAEVNDVTGVVFQLDGLAHVALRTGRPERAHRLAGAASALRASTGTQLSDYLQAAVGQGDRASLSPEEAARARSEGEAMTPEQAVAYALEDD